MQVRRLFLTATLAAALVCLPTAARASYLLDHGDSVSVVVRDNAKWGGTFPVRPDGTIVIPFLLEVDVRGMSVEQLRDQVRTALAKQLHDPDVNVSVSTYRPRIVTVLGEVATPGNLVLSRVDQTVLDTIAAAGGFTERALPSQVTLLRGTGEATRRIPIDLAAILASGDMQGDIRVEPGDRIQVGRNPWPSWREAFATTQQVIGYLGTLSLLLMLVRQATPPQP